MSPNSKKNLDMQMTTVLITSLGKTKIASQIDELRKKKRWKLESVSLNFPS